jgi:hypothetical protein
MLTFTVAQQGRKSGGTQLDRSVIIVQHQLFLRGNGSMLVVPVPGQGKVNQCHSQCQQGVWCISC